MRWWLALLNFSCGAVLNFGVQLTDFKARMDKLKAQRSVFLEKKARQRQQAAADGKAADKLAEGAKETAKSKSE